ncbi:MAG TPA: hypothetical protein GX733_09195 [Tissierellia bacterium]|nr:hypothetical protein [Tissierellia bacterium]
MRVIRFGGGGCLFFLLILFLLSALISFIFRSLGSGSLFSFLILLVLGYYFLKFRSSSERKNDGPEYTIVDDDEDEDEHEQNS